MGREGAATHIDVRVRRRGEACRDGRCFRPQVVAAKGTGWGWACPAGFVMEWDESPRSGGAAYNRRLSSATRKNEGMWYVIEGHDGPDVLAKRLAARPAHLARLTALRDEGRLMLAGPCPAIDAEDPGPAGFSGSLVVAEFASLEEARAWADADPYIAAGVYARVDVRPFKRVLP